jgi:hypothetical protein
MPFRIRHLGDTDISALVRLLNEVLRNLYEFIPYTDQRLRIWTLEGRFKIFIVEESGRIIGSATYNDGHWGEEVGWLVVPESPNR